MVNYEGLESEALKKLAEFLWINAELIGKRQYYNQEVILFALDKEYIEVWYSSDEEVNKVAPTNDSKILALYVQNIDLSSLFE